MSGGHFYNCDPSQVGRAYCGEWQDEEINALFFDLFGAGWEGWRYPFSGRERICEFGRTWAGNGNGLAEALDLYLDGDITEEDYREQVERFKKKWLVKKTPKNRVAFYQKAFREYAEDIMKKMEAELGGADDGDSLPGPQ